MDDLAQDDNQRVSLSHLDADPRHWCAMIIIAFQEETVLSIMPSNASRSYPVRRVRCCWAKFGQLYAVVVKTGPSDAPII